MNYGPAYDVEEAVRVAAARAVEARKLKRFQEYSAAWSMLDNLTERFPDASRSGGARNPEYRACFDRINQAAKNEDDADKMLADAEEVHSAAMWTCKQKKVVNALFFSWWQQDLKYVRDGVSALKKHA
ncbi:hypothetical protein FI667_g2261, partial [Globisporangium splendens]